MAWFRNHYRCARCRRTWTDEWSCTCDDDCPHCGARHMSPTASDDLTIIVDKMPDGTFVVLQSPATAEHDPDYAEVAHFPTREAADAWRPA
jgi:DNA-directed RNA polymerase subunit RPC12/RpoP